MKQRTELLQLYQIVFVPYRRPTLYSCNGNFLMSQSSYSYTNINSKELNYGIPNSIRREEHRLVFLNETIKLFPREGIKGINHLGQEMKSEYLDKVVSNSMLAVKPYIIPEISVSIKVGVVLYITIRDNFYWM